MGISSALTEKSQVIASVEAASMQDKADSSWHPSPAPFFYDRPVTRLKSKQAPKRQVQTVVHKGVHYTTWVLKFMQTEIQRTCV